MADFDQFFRQFEQRPPACPPQLPQEPEPDGWEIRFVSPIQIVIGIVRRIGRVLVFLYAIAFWGIAALILLLIFSVALVEAWK